MAMFVTFEGPEGAGKSTLVRGLALELERRGFDPLCTREPGAGELGRKIRALLLEGEALSKATELFLFLADRSNHVAKTISPALEAGKVVLCDRFADSTWVYQSYARGLDADFVERCNGFATGGLVPDLTFLLDLPAQVGLSRLQSMDRLDAEPLEFHERVREGFLLLAKSQPKRWNVVDATLAPESVQSLTLSLILERLSQLAHL